MKKTIIVSFTLILALSMLGCGSKSKSGRADTQNNKVEDVLEENMNKEDGKGSAQDKSSEDKTAEESSEKKQPAVDKSVDIDLSVMNKTLVFSEVSNMMMEPDKYKGRKVKMKGECRTYHDSETGKDYFTCLIRDAQACCQRGIEFELTDNYAKPDDYPRDGAQIVVKGVFDTYMEGENMYCTLVDGTLIE